MRGKLDENNLQVPIEQNDAALIAAAARLLE